MYPTIFWECVLTFFNLFDITDVIKFLKFLLEKQSWRIPPSLLWWDRVFLRWTHRWWTSSLQVKKSSSVIVQIFLKCWTISKKTRKEYLRILRQRNLCTFNLRSTYQKVTLTFPTCMGLIFARFLQAEVVTLRTFCGWNACWRNRTGPTCSRTETRTTLTGTPTHGPVLLL